MSIVAIMQPTYLPWSGYFGLINLVDKFVFLDDVQFDKRSWQQRNKIKTSHGEQWLTVPVATKGKSHQLIKEVNFDKTRNFKKEHRKSIELNYKKAIFFEEFSSQILSIYDKEYDLLVDLNINFIKTISKILNIEVKFIRSSEIPVLGIRDEKLLNICKEVSASTYVSPPGSKNYLEGLSAFTGSGVALDYIEFDHPVYEQLYGSFLPNMSIIDLIFNVGKNSLNLLKSSTSIESD